MKKLWIVIVFCFVVVVIAFVTSSDQPQAKASVPRVATTAPQSVQRAAFDWPEELPKPGKVVIRKDPPKTWLDPDSKLGDIFDRYTDEFEVSVDGSRRETTVQEVLDSYSARSARAEFDPEKIGPVYLIHRAKTDGTTSLVGLLFSLDVIVDGQAGTMSYFYPPRAGDVSLTPIGNYFVPRSRPLTPGERSKVLDYFAESSKIDRSELYCDCAVTIRHSRNGAQIDGLGIARADLSEAQGDGASYVSVTSFWVTRWYFLDPTDYIYYSEKPLEFWE